MYEEKILGKEMIKVSDNSDILGGGVSTFMLVEDIRKRQDELDWEYISECQKLSEDFIREFQDKVNWEYISKYQKLSEDFIREFQDKVNWSTISFHQSLSYTFIKEFEDKINFKNIYKRFIEKVHDRRINSLNEFETIEGVN